MGSVGTCGECGHVWGVWLHEGVELIIETADFHIADPGSGSVKETTQPKRLLHVTTPLPFFRNPALSDRNMTGEG